MAMRKSHRLQVPVELFPNRLVAFDDGVDTAELAEERGFRRRACHPVRGLLVACRSAALIFHFRCDAEVRAMRVLAEVDVHSLEGEW